MKFREWLNTTNLSVAAFARLMEIDRNTVFRMLKDLAPSKKVHIKLSARTKNMKVPLTYKLMGEMFKISEKPKKSNIYTCHCEDCLNGISPVPLETKNRFCKRCQRMEFYLEGTGWMRCPFEGGPTSRCPFALI